MINKLFFLCIAVSLFAASFNVSSVSEFQSALTTSQNNGENDIINVAVGTYNVSSTLTYVSGENNTLTINGASGVVLNGADASQIMNLRSTWADSDISVLEIAFTDGFSSTTAGGLYIETDGADLSVFDCDFSGCHANEMAGGVNAVTNGGTINIDGCSFVACVGVQNAGGINAGSSTGTIYVTNCTFDSDSVEELIDPESHVGGDGGGCLLYTEDGRIDMNYNEFTNCWSPDDGAGGFAYLLGSGVMLNANGNVCTNNNCVLDGAGLFLRINNSGIMTIRDNELTNNQTSVAEGGGVFAYMNQGTMEFVHNTMIGNGTAANGGGAWLWTGTGAIRADSNVFSSNVASENGGGLSIMADEGAASIRWNIFDSNEAEGVGGGMNLATTSGDFDVINNTFYDNVSPDGGGIYAYFDAAGSSCIYQNNIHYMDDIPAISWSGIASFAAEYCNIQSGTGEDWFSTGCIDTDPMFENPASGDFRLSWDNYPTVDGSMSPCIDSGELTGTDPDGTRRDMGAISFNQGSAIVEETQPDEFDNCKVYPNPFIGNTTVEIPQGAIAEIYNINGKKITTLKSTTTWSPANAESGVYLIKFTTQGATIPVNKVLVHTH